MWLHFVFVEAVGCEIFPDPVDAGRRLQRVNAIWVFTRQAGKCAFWSNSWAGDIWACLPPLWGKQPGFLCGDPPSPTLGLLEHKG